MPWVQVFGRQRLRPLPKSVGKSWDRAQAGSGNWTYTTKTPHSGIPSVIVARALVHLHVNAKLELASRMWHAVALRPHTVVRSQHGDVFLVISQ